MLVGPRVSMKNVLTAADPFHVHAYIRVHVVVHLRLYLYNCTACKPVHLYISA